MRETRPQTGTAAIVTRNPNLNAYLREISQVPLLTISEEVELAVRIHRGDRNAFDKLVESNLRFVVMIAKNFQRPHVPFLDIVQAGNIGLMKAARSFDETRGFKFISFAVWWVRQSIISFLGETERLVRIPVNKVGDIIRYDRAISAFEQKHQRRPNTEELATELGITQDKVEETMKAKNGIGISIEAPSTDEDAPSMKDRLADEDFATDAGIISEGLTADICTVLSTLDPREAYVISHLFGISATVSTLDEIGAKLGLSRERVRQIKDSALRKMKQSSDILRQYVA